MYLFVCIIQKEKDGLKFWKPVIKISREENINIFKSFNINLNIPLIKKSSNINGGKSGEFFFKTYDHRFIMKTIREDEA